MNGQAEIAGTPPELLEVFSKRAGEVEAALEHKVDEFRARQGREPTRWEHAALTREAAVDTRAHKSGNGVADLRSRWLDEAAAVGWDAPALIDQLHSRRPHPARPASSRRWTRWWMCCRREGRRGPGRR